ncbi:hypothetical protein L218DRAFT_447044 [Marasmius fiardii PR-910]|nr:hypothetical protein L218DRAFT_447044 [Marasmius fiardii PR-910]
MHDGGSIGATRCTRSCNETGGTKTLLSRRILIPNRQGQLPLTSRMHIPLQSYICDLKEQGFRGSGTDRDQPPIIVIFLQLMGLLGLPWRTTELQGVPPSRSYRYRFCLWMISVDRFSIALHLVSDWRRLLPPLSFRPRADCRVPQNHRLTSLKISISAKTQISKN